MKNINSNTFQNILLKLKIYWSMIGCSIIQPLDIEIGAATSHPLTFFKTINPQNTSIAYIQSCRRPTDGRYGKNSNRLNHYYQFQVLIKPSPENIQNIYINSLKYLGINTKIHDIKFIEDNWENPTLGAWGLGWEILLNGIEITQFTYFQQMGGISCNKITVEITYGLERLAMCIQKVDNVYDIIWNENIYSEKITYSDFFKQNEEEHSKYNFEYSDIIFLIQNIKKYKEQALRLLNLKKPLIFPAYEFILKSINNFNILDSRRCISSLERQQYILSFNKIIKVLSSIYCTKINYKN